MMKNYKKYFFLVTFFGIFFTSITLYFHRVNNSLTEEDRNYIQLYLKGINSLSDDSTYEDQLKFLFEVQNSVLTLVSGNEGIPYGSTRNPKDVYIAQSGLCYDRSRTIEKILNYAGFETRHLFILSTEKTGSNIKSLISGGVASHAVTEVLTKNGWLIVDSNIRWISIDENRQAISIKTMQLYTNNAIDIDWYSKQANYSRIF